LTEEQYDTPSVTVSSAFGKLLSSIMSDWTCQVM